MYDIIIVGGGLVGASLAVALRHSHLRIALIDAKLPAHHDVRLFALNKASCEFLEKIGIWTTVAHHATPIHQVHVSNQGKFGAIRLKREALQLESLGYVIPARFLEMALNEILMQLSHCTVYRPAPLQSLQIQDKTIVVTINIDGAETTLTASSVIAADGTESTVRKQLNIATDIIDYEQSAIVTTTQLTRHHQHIAYERFSAQGAIAMLPLDDQTCATIWTANNPFISHLQTLSEHKFLENLQKQFGFRLGRLQGITQRHYFPLRRVLAKTITRNSIFLLGNAAHTLHPIAAQGFNLALYEVAVLADEIIKKKQAALTQENLQRVSEKIAKQQAVSLSISHQLPRIFSNQHSFLSPFIQLGMMGFEMLPFIKNKWMTTLIEYMQN